MMTLIATSADGRAMRLAVAGHLSHDDYRAMIPAMEAAIARHGNISLLADMTALDSMSPRAVLDDLAFDLGHLRDFERLAVVGNREWQEWMTRLAAHMTSAEMRYFDAAEAEAAWVWAQDAPQETA